MVFGVSPATAGVEQASDGGFPNFIQFQEDGTDLGLPDADTLNFSTGLTATRGTGENENVITVVSEGGGGSALQFQDNGTDLGAADATTVNFVGGLTAFRIGDTIYADARTPVWRTVSGPYPLQAGDFMQGVRSLDGGAFTLPSDSDVSFPEFTSVLALDLSIGSPLTFVAGAGAAVLTRAGLIAQSAGTNSMVSIIKTAANTWTLAGDLAAG